MRHRISIWIGFVGILLSLTVSIQVKAQTDSLSEERFPEDLFVEPVQVNKTEWVIFNQLKKIKINSPLQSFMYPKRFSHFQILYAKNNNNTPKIFADHLGNTGYNTASKARPTLRYEQQINESRLTFEFTAPRTYKTRNSYNLGSGLAIVTDYELKYGSTLAAGMNFNVFHGRRWMINSGFGVERNTISMKTIVGDLPSLFYHEIIITNTEKQSFVTYGFFYEISFEYYLTSFFSIGVQASIHKMQEHTFKDKELIRRYIPNNSYYTWTTLKGFNSQSTLKIIEIGPRFHLF